MKPPTLDSLTEAFTQATVDADGFPTAFHSGTAAVVRELIEYLDYVKFRPYGLNPLIREVNAQPKGF